MSRSGLGFGPFLMHLTPTGLHHVLILMCLGFVLRSGLLVRPHIRSAQGPLHVRSTGAWAGSLRSHALSASLGGKGMNGRRNARGTDRELLLDRRDAGHGLSRPDDHEALLTAAGPTQRMARSRFNENTRVYCERDTGFKSSSLPPLRATVPEARRDERKAPSTDLPLLPITSTIGAC